MSSDNEKLKAFRNFDWDNPEWKAYVKNVEIPSGAPTAMEKVKAKWYKRTVDPDFDVSWVTTPSSGTTQQEAPKASSTADASSGSAGNQSHPGSTQPGSASSSSWSTPAGTGRIDPISVYMGSLNAMLLVLSFLYIQPLFPSFTSKLYSMAMQSAVISQGMNIYKKYGKPVFTLPGLQAWYLQANQTSDLSYFLSALVFWGQKPLSLVLVSYAIRAAYQLSNLLNSRMSQAPLWQKYGTRVHAFLVTKEPNALFAAAGSEIALGILQVVLLLLPDRRSFVTTFFVWQMLKARYWLPDTARYHRQGWAMVDQRTEAIRQQLPPLENVIGYARRWFNTPPLRG